MSYRLGVDVGGTFTDVLLVDEASGATWRAKTASTPQDQAFGVLNGIARSATRPASRSPRSRRSCTARPPRPTPSSRARAPPSASSRRRASARSCRSPAPTSPAAWGWIIWPKPEPLAALENTVEVDERIAIDGGQIRPLDETAPAPRWPGSPASRRSRSRSSTPSPTRPTSAGCATSPPRCSPGSRSRSPPTSCRAAGVRAHRDDGRQRLRPAAGQALRHDAQRSAARGRGRGRAGHPAQRRRPVLRAGRHRRAGDDAALRARPRGDRRGVGRRAVRLPRPHHLRHAAPRPTSPSSRAWPRGSAARPRSATSPSAPPASTSAPSARAALDRARAAADPCPAGGPQSAGADPARRPTARVAPSRRSPTPTSSSATCPRTSPAARSGSTPGGPHRRRHRGRRDGAAVAGGRGGRHRRQSSTRTCSAACGSSPSSRASTRATSPSSPSAARGRCTPTPSGSSPARGRSSSRRRPRAVRPRGRDDLAPRRVGAHRAAPASPSSPAPSWRRSSPSSPTTPAAGSPTRVCPARSSG